MSFGRLSNAQCICILYGLLKNIKLLFAALCMYVILSKNIHVYLCMLFESI